ncbi:hypothetical protein [Novosphingobium mangrovi (ex Huang et al. 2023)]|uniref:MBL fold metallo-hydrolase n=1 Tax=Novosphingobium mangrovi (ex Huang et al. 2023) TaxID=2976432 RepID=A0ABT2I3I2_9SPHN|nr:hypothetical protein [Novosphingobium mangrovi (ex Huang et al. 2023)]MCT2399371.1 hypothetical protein [Novosphingobium mangrovi (ex Huang et al. 2023)]
MTRRLNYWLLALLVVVGVPFYWYLIDPGHGQTQAKPVTMAQLRELAGSIEGPLPTKVRVELIGYRSVMRDRLVAGWGLRPTPYAIHSYQLIVPGEKPIVIDAGTSPEVARDLDVENFSSSAQKRVNRALADAGHVVILQDGPLRNGGRVEGQDGADRSQQPTASAPHALAPGVVVIPADGLGPDAKMVYVRLGNGREFLFAGPAALVDESLRSLRPPAKLAARADVPDYRTESKEWLMTINALRQDAPHMTVVTGGDPAPASHTEKWFFVSRARD